MKRLVDVTSEEARLHFLKCSSYFNNDLPHYISFQPILDGVAAVLDGSGYSPFQGAPPNWLPDVNYSLIANKDGRLSWRPFELIHPAIYVSLVDVLCTPENWQTITARLSQLEGGVVECCSSPVISTDLNTDAAAQVRSWWQKVEQRSLVYSLEFSHLVHTDVTDCYGSLYTHSIAWAIHGLEEAKANTRTRSLLGNIVDAHIQAGRYGQTNGISQGSILMDFVAECVLAYVDGEINTSLGYANDVNILRYRDDYRIFANSDQRAEQVLKIVSDSLRKVGMRLGVSKTMASRNVVEGAVKPDKLAGLELLDLGEANANTIQKRLLRLHAFGQRFPNSGTLRRLVTGLLEEISRQDDAPRDLDVQIAIATDIAVVSPSTFPAVAGILSHLVSQAARDEKRRLWERVSQKMRRVPYNGYLEMWLQRVTMPRTLDIQFESEEPICQIVSGRPARLWNCSWITSRDLLAALDVSKIVVGSAPDAEEQVQPSEVVLFAESAYAY